MSRIPSRTAARRLTLAVGAVAAAATIFPSPASAAFTTGKCLGDGIVGQGASFAKLAHDNAYMPAFANQYCAAVGSAPSIAYTGSGSGAGRRAFGARSGANADGSQSRTSADRFVGTDEPMGAADQANINKGTDAVGDEGLVHTLPIALGSVAIVVNLPDGCLISEQATGAALTTEQAAQLSDPTDADRSRLQLKREQLEKAFNGGTDLDTWGELVPWINDGNETAGEPTDTACANFPITRVVRLDSSGTTFALKDYLSRINPGRGWVGAFADNLTWPNPTVNKTQGSGSGNGPLVDKVFGTDGSIGYTDLATARARQGKAFERQNGADDKYWVKIQAKNLTGFVDPQAVADGFRSGGTPGSSCNTALLTGLPQGTAPTLGDWTQVSANDSTPAGYGICTPTYALAWDDYATPYKLLPTFNAAAEERKARTVKDYLESMLTTGQQNLLSYDYAPLAPGVADFTLAAVRSIGFDKAGDTGGVTPDPPVVEQPRVEPPVGGNNVIVQPPAIVAPSNAFTLGKAKNSKGVAKLTIQVPGPGSVTIAGTATIGKKKNQKIGNAAYQPKAGGAVALSLKPTSKAAKELKKKKKLKVTLTITYTPAGGQPKSTTATVTLKPAPSKKKKKTSKK